MITTIKSSNVTWVDIINPSKKDVNELKERFNIHPLILNELLRPSLRSKVDDYGSVLYMVLHFPVFDHQKRQSIPIEIDFIIGHNLLITARYQKLPPLEEFHRRSSSELTNHEFNISKNCGQLLYYVMREMFEFSLRELDHIRRSIDKIEEGIFNNEEKMLIGEILGVRRDILGFRKAMKPQKSTLESLLARSRTFFGEDMKGFFSFMLGDYLRVWNLVENYKEMIEALQQTNESLLTTKTNEVIKILTIFSVFALPVSIIGEFYSAYSWKHVSFATFVLVSFLVMAALVGVIMYLKKKKLI
jgi:magnesium transporter